MNSKYLDSVMINHEKSGFCILEFSLNHLKRPRNLKVVMSSGDSFNDMAFSILQSMRISESRKKSGQTNNTLRLPIYFKN
jgi:hypothetical protein